MRRKPSMLYPSTAANGRHTELPVEDLEDVKIETGWSLKKIGLVLGVISAVIGLALTLMKLPDPDELKRRTEAVDSKVDKTADELERKLEYRAAGIEGKQEKRMETIDARLTGVQVDLGKLQATMEAMARSQARMERLLVKEFKEE